MLLMVLLIGPSVKAVHYGCDEILYSIKHIAKIFDYIEQGARLFNQRRKFVLNMAQNWYFRK